MFLNSRVNLSIAVLLLLCNLSCDAFTLRDYILINSTMQGISGGGYFGYTIAGMPTSSGIVRLLIGAPKSRQSLSGTTQGTLYVTKLNISSREANIETENPEKNVPVTVTNLRKDADSIGFTISASGNNTSVCVPQRYRRCKTHNIISGSCFHSLDFGETWKTAKPTIPQCSDQAIDLIFVLDGSFSVGKSNFELVKEWVIALTKSFEIEKEDNFGVIQYSHFYNETNSPQPYMKTEIQLGAYKNFSVFENITRAITLQGFTTYTAHALDKTLQDFMASPRFNFENVTKVMILITDGRADDAHLLPTSAQNLRNKGIVTFAIGIGASLTDQLQIVANGNLGDNTRVFAVQNFSSLQSILNQLRVSIKQDLEGAEGVNTLEYAEAGFSSTHQTVC